ncbi:MAG: Fe-S-containing hydro-lyase [Eubacteriaceae bacterium]|jgi:fumarate hydratase subunit beta|nr:Fe-S-containing hydro-lyase [Eubacteriaceae bacterium]
MKTYDLTTPMTEKEINTLQAGDKVLISGVIYTARDAAHKRMIDTLEAGGSLPFDIRGQMIYYMGPTPAREGQVIGSAGPTTAGRMDFFTPQLLERGLSGMLAKGMRSQTVIDAMQKYGAVYFGAVGGAGAYLSSCIKAAEVIAYDDLGPEAIRRLEVEKLPAIVLIDRQGNDLYKIGRKKYECLEEGILG